MSGCAFIGDSIALGLAIVSSACDRAAVTGRSTPAIIRSVPHKQYRWAVLSAGSNDVPHPVTRNNLRMNLMSLRQRVHARRIIWIVPQHPYAAARVTEVALQFGDEVQGFSPAPDGVHPKSYQALWRKINRRLEH